MSIEVIVFDLGKVIFDFDISKLSNDLSRSSTKTYYDINNILSNHWEIVAQYEKGQISSKLFYEKVTDLLGLTMPYDKFCDSWNNIFIPFNDVINFLGLLSKKYKLSLLSNTNDLHFEYLKNKYPETFNSFKYLHLSYKMQARKPETEIYKKVIDFYNINPSSIFFTDDLDKNINSAKELNISAFKFEGLEKLKEDLNSLGVVF
jgi:putative hydrolase of the HAD superfamily